MWDFGTPPQPFLSIAFGVVADQAKSGLQLYTEELFELTPLAPLSRGFGRVGVFLMRRLEVGLGALAVVWLSVGGLLP